MIAARPARPEELQLVQHITGQAYGPWVPVLGSTPLPMLDDYAPRIAAGEVSLVERDGVVAGLLVVARHPDHMMIESLAVLPAAQGNGIGRWMLDHIQDMARSSGVPAIRLYTNVKMVRNIALYRRYGFVVGEVRHPKPDHPEFGTLDMEFTVR